MPTTVFSQTTGRTQRALRVSLWLCFFALIAIYAFDYWTSGELVFEVRSFAVAIVAMSLFYWISRRVVGPPKPRTVTLDEQGLTYAAGLASRSWHWTELSAANIQRPGPRSAPYVRIPVDSIDWKIRWTLMESLSKSEIRLHDIYDASLTDIAAKLNDYRDRALAASGAGAAG